MPDVTISQYMDLPIPIPSQDPGPQYASDLNSCLTLIDQHDHAAGSGVQITPSGLNINADLDFITNNAIGLLSSRYTAQNSPLAGASDLGCTYVSGADLYYNDTAGNQVRITASGSVAGTPGSIGSLVSPASVTWVVADETYVFESDVNTAGNIDCGSVIIREVAASANGVTLSSPVALAANYTLTFPGALPGSGTKLATIDNSGNIGASWAFNPASIAVTANVVAVAAGAISATELASNAVTTSKILDANVTRAKLEAVGQQISSSCGTFTRTSGAYADVTNLSVNLTTSGRPVRLALQTVAAGSSAIFVGSSGGAITSARAQVALLRDGSIICEFTIGGGGASSADLKFYQAVSGFAYLDVPAAGTYAYKVQAKIVDSNNQVNIENVVLVAYEL